jgi:hypothetical protein
MDLIQSLVSNSCLTNDKKQYLGIYVRTIQQMTPLKTTRLTSTLLFVSFELFDKNHIFWEMILYQIFTFFIWYLDKISAFDCKIFLDLNLNSRSRLETGVSSEFSFISQFCDYRVHWGKADVESGKNIFCRLNCFYNVF